MILKTDCSHLAYDSYYRAFSDDFPEAINILEIGGGAHSSLINRNNINYTIVDPDTNELTKAPQDTIKLNTDGVLKFLENRDLKDMPKYKAYYQRTKGHTKSQLTYFEKIGYNVEMYHSL